MLGTIEDDDRQAVLADIPGLIEGAAEGAGLGHEFLAHVERCAMLVHLVDLAPLEGEPVTNYEAVRAELSSYGAGLDRLPELVVLSKRDLLDRGSRSRRRSRSGASGWATARSACWRSPRRPARGSTSCAGGSSPSCPRPPPRSGRSGEPAEFEAEHRVYRPAGEGGYWVEREGDGVFRVVGRGVELLVRAPRPQQRGGARLPRAAPAARSA